MVIGRAQNLDFIPPRTQAAAPPSPVAAKAQGQTAPPFGTPLGKDFAQDPRFAPYREQFERLDWEVQKVVANHIRSAIAGDMPATSQHNLLELVAGEGSPFDSKRGGMSRAAQLGVIEQWKVHSGNEEFTKSLKTLSQTYMFQTTWGNSSDSPAKLALAYLVKNPSQAEARDALLLAFRSKIVIEPPQDAKRNLQKILTETNLKAIVEVSYAGELQMAHILGKSTEELYDHQAAAKE